MMWHSNTRNLFLILIFILVVTCYQVRADTHKKTIRLDLPHMIERAISVSPEINAAQSDLNAAQSDLDAVNAAFYPQIESTAIVGPVQDAKRPIIVNNRIHDPSPTGLSHINVFGRLNFTVTQPLYTFGKLTNQKNAAHMGILAQQQEVLKTADDIALRVTQLYYALTLARTGLNTAQDAESFFTDAQHLIKALLKVKSPNVTQSDLYMIDALRAGAASSRVEAQKAMSLATCALCAMLKIPPDVKLEIIPESPQIKKGKLKSLKAYIQLAYSNRPELKQLSAAIKASQYQLAAAKADLWPSLFVALEGYLAKAPGREHLDNPYITDEFNRHDIGVVVGARWNLDFGIKKAKIRHIRAEYQKMLYNQKRMKMAIPIQVAKAYNELIEWKKKVEIYHNAAVSARKWVVSAFADFGMGLGTAENLLRAIQTYSENQGNYIDALYHYNMAMANLKYATGMIRPKSQN